MMFKKTCASALILLFLVVAYIFYYCFYLLPKDVKRYEDYLEQVQTPHAHRNTETTEQLRTVVQKDIWHDDHGTRLHYRIQADTSILTLTPVGKTISLEEKLHHVSCAFQEKLYQDALKHPMQQLNTFYADAGVYDFTRHDFSASTVFLKFYTLPGHTLPLTLTATPFLKGCAQSVGLTLSARGPTFHAEKFTAHMDFREYER